MARKKNAPAIKSNLRDVPADKFRAVNRMNGIVTMVEYSSEDDIKAYELEPTYRELGGGGVSIPFDICNITIVNNTSSSITFMVVPQLRNSALIVTESTIAPIIVEANSEYQMALPFVWVSNPDTPEIMIFFQNRMNFSNAVNCSYVAGESDQPDVITRTTNGNASITLSVPTEV